MRCRTSSGRTPRRPSSEREGGWPARHGVALEEWDPTQHEDRYRKRLQKIVRDQRKGKTIEVPDDAGSEPGPPPDLMAALKEALAAATK